MTVCWLTRIIGSAIALLVGVAFPIASAVAQEATPIAQETADTRPAHIHSGSCVELGDVVTPLSDLTTATGEGLGQAGEAAQAEFSFTTIPMTIDTIISADHAINVHLSNEQIETYIACGELGGVIDAGGSLIVGLREESSSGYTGIAFLAPGADGASTNVSVFIAPVLGAAG